MARGLDYFNEIDPAACATLRENFVGVIDARSIKEVHPHDIAGRRHCHFFAGAGLWAVAAAMARWPDDRPLWTASCPCQPFSAAGKGRGRDDPRHLWPDLFRLARAARPPILVGEQVASAAGRDWFDGVASDLEGIGYACRPVDIPACAVDAPHRRNRIYWVAVADAARGGRARLGEPERAGLEGPSRRFPVGYYVDGKLDRASGTLADANRRGCDGRSENTLGHAERRTLAQRPHGGLVDAARERRGEGRPEHELWSGRDAASGANGTFWTDSEWLNCADRKARRAKRGIRMLAPRVAGRADLWRMAGNSVVPQLAAEVLSALLETLEMSEPRT